MTALPTGLTSGTWTIDPSHTEASFTVRHAGISKVRGTVAVTSGTLTVGDDLESSSVTVTLDPSTVSTGDANRDGHLKSNDFFDVETFGEWTFTSTAVRASGDGHVVVGDLTIHGVTREVELAAQFNGTAVDPFGNTRAGFEAELTISRKDFGLTWNAALEAGGVLVADKVRIDLDVSAIQA
ncbi:YceI family protein [Cellulomonas flavigena DSM 20109]|uniref:YceI family protein n=1 Tax=Cellulomonas flavigena (strain ATCC 482 / DSM 20109 / BCRC 11376 / JCM 18109 / NBRC 3775 / NCIMB 8073 / NRS 134) TaxID=446466 RepID=D5UJI5_CELFN|nr:YceI family protein [Cellulomonas flavigena]ADG75623.1 YceI family protein [Cellulomonas flavigena DSM 20109]